MFSFSSPAMVLILYCLVCSWAQTFPRPQDFRPQTARELHDYLMIVSNQTSEVMLRETELRIVESLSLCLPPGGT
jgi:hypothetical protein